MLTVLEVREILESKNLLVGGELFYLRMRYKLGLERDFNYNEIYIKDEYNDIDIEKIYDYFTETQYYIDQIDPSNINYINSTTNFNYENRVLNVNRENMKIINHLEYTYKLENKFKVVEKEYIEIEDKKANKFINTKVLLGITLVGIAAYLMR